MEDDLEEEIAELVGESRRGARPERVVDLVGLLEEMVAERLVGLLAIPRAAVREPQPMRDPGHRPGARDRPFGRERTEVQRPGQGIGGQLADRQADGRAEPADLVIGRVEPAEDRDGIGTTRTVAAREDRCRPGRIGRPAAAPGVHPEDGCRDDQDRPARLERGRDEVFGRDDLEARGEVQPPAEARLGDERIEHDGPAPTG